MKENLMAKNRNLKNIKISAFADEIAPDLATQIEHLKLNGVGYIELRGVDGKNVMQLARDEVKDVKRRASDAGIGFSAVGSPLGKFPLDGDFNKQMDDLKISPAFSCNCILNYLYGNLEGQQSIPIGGPATFGEIAYVLLNQTMVFMIINEV